MNSFTFSKAVQRAESGPTLAPSLMFDTAAVEGSLYVVKFPSLHSLPQPLLCVLLTQITISNILFWGLDALQYLPKHIKLFLI